MSGVDLSTWSVLAPLLAGLTAALLPSARLAAILSFLGVAVSFAAACMGLAAGEANFALCVSLAIAGVGALALLAGVGAARGRLVGPLVAIGIGVSMAMAASDDLLLLAGLGAGLGAVQIALSLACEEDGRGAPLVSARLLTVMASAAAALGGASLAAIGHSAGAPLALMGFAGLAGLAPAHGALAETAGRAPSAGAAALAVAFRLAPFAAVLRAFGVLGSGQDAAVMMAVVAGLGALGVALGVAQATVARDLRRAAAHLFTAHAGLALLVAATGGADAIGACLFITGQAACVCAALALGPARLSDLDGWGHARPAMALLLTGLALALGGAPTTAAFLSRWLAIEQTLARGWYWAAAMAALTAFGALVVAGRMLGRLYFAPAVPRGPAPAATGAALSAIAVGVALQIAAGLGGGDAFVALLGAGRGIVAP